MTEITIFRADDGTDFEDEWDCRTYEWSNNAKSASYMLLDYKYNVLPNSEVSSYEDCAYIFLPSVQSVNDLLSNWDIDLIAANVPAFLPRYSSQSVDIGLWAWDEDLERWYHLGKKIDELTEQANKVMDVINGV